MTRAFTGSLLVASACIATPTPAECVDSVDPDLRADGLVGAPPEAVFRLREPADIRIMTINIGNGDTSDGNRYPLRLAFQAYEDFFGARMRQLAPAVIAVQEALPRSTCLGMGEDGDAETWESDPERTCWKADERPDQIQRLLGGEYSIVCDAISSVDCLGVHRGFGSILGLGPGEYQASWRQTAPFPEGFTRCDYSAGECAPKRKACEVESSISWIDVETLAGSLVRVVHLHPSAFADSCREHQLQQAFDLARQAPEGADVLMLGDWNTDPDRLDLPVEEVLWYANVGPDRWLREHDERNAACARIRTAPLRVATVDHVVSSFAKGFCRVFERHRSLGYESSLGRFDEDFPDFNVFPDGENDQGRMDHAAVLCDLRIPDDDDREAG